MKGMFTVSIPQLNKIIDSNGWKLGYEVHYLGMSSIDLMYDSF